jgi:tRNA 5-methylaminomethyl-2-thiouridine biosynthesis bifunctional protein
VSTPFEPIQTAVITWVDGLPYANTYADIYFSADNGLQEAMHVFIEGNQLVERWQALSCHLSRSQGNLSRRRSAACPRNPENTLRNREDMFSSPRFVIGETGFGTGLNFLLAWSVWDRVAPPDARLHFISCEKHPLSLTDLQQCLALWPTLADYAAALLDAYPVLTPGYHRLVFDEGRVTLDLMLGDALVCYQDRLLCGDPKLEQKLRRDHVDAWFLDGFSPNKNPDMWSDALCATLFQLSRQGTTFSTFSAAGMVKQALRSAGFEVNKRPGHGKKREMLVGSLVGTSPNQPSIKRKTPWHVAPAQPIKHQLAIVIGAGLSGCFMAYALAQRGWKVRLLDQQSTVGQGASGNHRSILFPNVSAYRAPITELMLSAFLYASRFYQQCIKRWPVGDFSGILQLIREKKTGKTQADLAQWLLAYPELGRLVDAATASDLSGVEVSSAGIFIPMAGWIDSPALCERLVQHPSIQFFPNTDVQSLEKDSSDQWIVAGHAAEVVVIANGHAANRFSQTKHLDIQSLRGQMTGIQASQQSRELLIPLCGDGHILPQIDGIHAIGATFRPIASNENYNLRKDLSGVVARHEAIQRAKLRLSGLLRASQRRNLQVHCGCLSSDDDENYSKIKTLSAQLDLSNTVMSHWAGTRGAALDHLPFVGPVADAALFSETFAFLSADSRRWLPSAGAYLNGLYIATGFGSRGLTTIPLCAEYLAGLINHEPTRLPQHLVQSISPARFLHRNIIRRYLC